MNYYVPSYSWSFGTNVLIILMVSILVVLIIYVVLNWIFVYRPVSNIEAKVNATSADIENTLNTVNATASKADAFVGVICSPGLVKDGLCRDNCLLMNRLCPQSPCAGPCSP